VLVAKMRAAAIRARAAGPSAKLPDVSILDPGGAMLPP
jgi:hypothetical protein